MYKIVLKRSVQKDLDKINNVVCSKIISEIEKLKQNPRNVNVKKLVNRNNEYRLRVGNYRILFYIEETEKLIGISRVLHRRDAYN